MTTQLNADSQTSDAPQAKGTIMITLIFVGDPSPQNDQVCIMLHNGVDPPKFLDAQSITEIDPKKLLEQAINYQERLPTLRLEQVNNSKPKPQSVQAVQANAEPATPPSATKRSLF